MKPLAAILAAVLLAFSFPLSLPALPFAALDKLPLPGTVPDSGYAQLAWLAFVALVPLLEAVRLSVRPREAFIWGYACGVIWLVISWDWLSSFGWLPVLLLAGFFALGLGLFCVLSWHIIASGRAGLICWSLPLIWTALEYLRSFGFWAFPWNLLGYSQARNLPLIQCADIGGVFLVGFLIVLSNSALFVAGSAALGSLKARLGHGLLAAALLCAALSYGHWRLADCTVHPPSAPRPLSLALVQGGLDTFGRWNESRLQASLGQYVPASRAAVSQWQGERQRQRLARATAAGPFLQPGLLVIWPEAALQRSMDPRRGSRVPPEMRSTVLGRQDCALLAGAYGSPRDDRHMENGCLLIESTGLLRWPYSKLRLVPYGETVPFRELVSFLDYPWGDEDATEGRDLTPMVWHGYSLGLMVCFDNVFGFVSREQVRRGAQALVLMTNNSWYKLHSGIRQHCDMDTLRAVELRRPLARVSTTGWSHVLDLCGRVQQVSRVDEAATLQGDIMPATKASPYSVVGDLFAQLCLLGSTLLCGLVLLAGRSEGML